MIEDAAQVPHGATVSGDVLVVGGGPAGMTLAMELTASGREVLLLESGGTEPDRDTRALTRSARDDSAYYPLERTRERALGGTSHHWQPEVGMRARPLDPLDFEARPEVDRPGWPFGADELEPHYRRAHELCELGPWSYDLDMWDPAGTRRLRLGDDLETAVYHLGNHRTWVARQGLVGQLPHTRVLLGATVLEVVATPDGGCVDHLVVASGDRRFRVTGRTVVLACGGIDNARLLLVSRRTQSRGLGNGHDLVGRHFMEHPHVRSGTIPDAAARLQEAIRPYGLMPPGSPRTEGTIRVADHVLRREGRLGGACHLIGSTPALSTPAGRALLELRETIRHRRRVPGTWTRVGRLTRRAGQAARAARDGVQRDVLAPSPVVDLLLFGEQEPDRDNRITLGPNRDRYGIPLPRLHWRLTRRDREALVGLQEHLDLALRRRGLGHLEERLGCEQVGTPVMSGGFHHMGTTRMAASPREGVVDADGRVHGVGNLYVAGTSVFATAGLANPTLTVVALAVRLAGHLASERP